MKIESIGRSLILVTGAIAIAACGPKVTSSPPPQTPPAAEATSPDAALPAVPLTGRGVVVPTDVKLEPPPRRDSDPAPGVTRATMTPNAN